MKRCRFNEETGLAGKILVGVIAWALGAVLLLTNTLVAAQQIDNRVDRITHTVGPIDHDLDSVNLAAETNRHRQRDPGRGQARCRGRPTRSSRPRPASTLPPSPSTATSQQIGDDRERASTGTPARSTATCSTSTRRSRTSTGPPRRSAARSTASTATWPSIGGTVQGDRRQPGGRSRRRPGRSGAITLPPSSGFGSGIAGINRRADAVIALVQSIKGDTGNILATVLKVEASAKSIDRPRSIELTTRAEQPAVLVAGRIPDRRSENLEGADHFVVEGGEPLGSRPSGRAWNTKLIIVEPLKRK